MCCLSDCDLEKANLHRQTYCRAAASGFHPALWCQVKEVVLRTEGSFQDLFVTIEQRHLGMGRGIISHGLTVTSLNDKSD